MSDSALTFVWNVDFNPFIRAIQFVVEQIKVWWKAIVRWYQDVRQHGTHTEKRIAWKLMHDARRKSRKRGERGSASAWQKNRH